MLGIDIHNPPECVELYHMPDGQPHVKLNGFSLQIPSIIARFKSFSDLFTVAVVNDAFKEQGIPTELVLPYVPGARQDRRPDGESLTIKIIADFINRMEFSVVRVLHPHSDVTIALINHCRIIDHVPFVEKAIKHCNADFIVVPDLGASKESRLYERFGLPMVQCTKVRDTKTGSLSGFRVIDEIPDGHGIMVDDICDGGGTFLGLKKEFGNTLSLYTTHGLYSKGSKRLTSEFSNVYCTNSVLCNDLDGVVIFDFMEAID